MMSFFILVLVCVLTWPSPHLPPPTHNPAARCMGCLRTNEGRPRARRAVQDEPMPSVAGAAYEVVQEHRGAEVDREDGRGAG